MGFLSKVTNRTSDKAADKISSGIVNAIFGKKKKGSDDEYVEKAAPQAEDTPVTETEEARTLTPEEAEAINRAQADAMKNAEQAMGMAYNTKRCPECQAICMNSPVTCPYCGADLKGVKPLTPKELEELAGE